MDKQSEVQEKLYEQLRDLQEVAPRGFDPNAYVAHWFYDNADEEALAKIIADVEKEIDRYKSS